MSYRCMSLLDDSDSFARRVRLFQQLPADIDKCPEATGLTEEKKSLGPQPEPRQMLIGMAGK
jgi:hypothetical protein